MAKGNVKSGGTCSNKSSKVNACALGPELCKKPTGKISWVCCDGCSEWYHCSCVKVDPKTAAEIIYFCKVCKPLKEQEISEVRDVIKTSLSALLKEHSSIFSGAVFPRKCFRPKVDSTEYHFKEEKDPKTMRELIEKLDKDCPSIDHFKKMAETMFERMKEVLKDDYEDEIIRISKSVVKLVVDAIASIKPKSKPAGKSNTGKGTTKEKKGKGKEVEEEEEEEEDLKEKEPLKKGKKAKERKKGKEVKEEKKDTEEQVGKEVKQEKAEKKATEEKAEEEKEKEENKKDEDEEKQEQEGKKGREGRKEKGVKKQPAVKAKPKEKVKILEKESEEKSLNVESEIKPSVLKCKMCKGELAPPMYQCVDNHVVCHICLHASERGYCPTCRLESGKNRRPKKHDKWSTLQKADSNVTKMEEDLDVKMESDQADVKMESDQVDVKMEVDQVDVEPPKPVPVEPKVLEEEPLIKMDVDKIEEPFEPPALVISPPVSSPIPEDVQIPAPVQNRVVVATAPQQEQEPTPAALEPVAVAPSTATATKARKRRGKNADPAEGETKVKTKKIATPKPKRLTKAEKKLLEAASTTQMTQQKIEENAHPPKLETLLSSAAPANLPKSVLLPTSPIVQNLLPKSPQPQVAAVQAFQLRPTTAGSPQITAVPSASAGSPPQFRMQGSSPQQQPPLRPHGLQFFKIVEGKPVQIGAPASTSSIQPALPTSPLPTSPLPMQPNAAAGPGPKLLYVRNPLPASNAPSSSLSPTRPQLAQKQIILLSNKGPGKAHILTPVSPTNSQGGGIVKLVSTGGGNGEGSKLILGSNVARVAPQVQGPVLLRPVGPLPSPPLPQPQLPSVPLPRAALSTAPTADKAQALLPKSPLPPAQFKNTPMMKIPGGPTQVPTAPATTSTGTSLSSGSSSTPTKSDSSVINKAFVWKNSDKTQFKLSARFNFDLFREYQKAHPNKDIRFALASIITEDKSNEFSFHLSQQKEEENKDYWQLGVRAKNVSEHVWHLKVKVEPPVFLVNNGSFKQTMANFRIPKDISDKAVVDYELLLMGRASAVLTASTVAQLEVAAKSSRGTKKGNAVAQLQEQQQQSQKQPQ